MERTWQVAGLRGTGSHTFVGDGVFVPAQRVLTFPVGPRGVPDVALGEPLSLIALGLVLAAALAGAALGALDTVAGVLSERKPPMTPYQSLVESPSARSMFAEAEHGVRSGHDRLIHLASRIQEWPSGQEVPLTQRSALRMEMVSILRQFRHAVDLLMDVHGSSGFALDSPLQRFWRDLNMGARHVQFSSYSTTENHGLLLTGAGGPILPL